MKHNSYFEGKVQSLGINTPEGYATVGVIEPGQYTFSTDSEEHLTIIAGSMKVKLPGSSWQQVTRSDTFVVPPRASFDIDATAEVAYICYYK
ncbi:MAG: pyrimidine/purine nucleoside phosphorylase [Deltaproteobacteria bacterium]|nr:pyrimidine/purine nucleoside phosphorylase [Deltaproteobacteria bacterium]